MGAATARSLAEAGFLVVCAARRRERIEELAREIGGRPHELDVTDSDSVATLAGAVPDVSVVVHSAGGALGLEPIAEADEERWRAMYETNVLGVMRVTKALLPAIVARGDGHIVVIGSVAGVESYAGGAGYNAAKHGAHAFTKALRLEMLGKPVRVTEIAPGMVETEFSVVRFGGDTERADAVYAGMVPLSAEDVAELVTFAVTRPKHVDIDYVSIKPTQQATATEVHREA